MIYWILAHSVKFCAATDEVEIDWITALHHSGLNLSRSKIRFGIRSIRHGCLRPSLLRSLFPSSLFPFFSPSSHFETRSSISSFLERSQMAFLLMLAVGVYLNARGRKERHSKAREKFMDWAMATAFCSKRTRGFRVPFYIASISLTFLCDSQRFLYRDFDVRHRVLRQLSLNR